MSILFCDIDGVLRTHNSDTWWSDKLNAPIPKRVFDRKFSPKCVSNLNYTSNLLRYKIVVTSTWRTQHDLNQLISIFRSNGVYVPVIGVTNILSNRGEEIVDWLDRNPTQKYAVIDDVIKDIKNYIKPEYIIKCDTSIGFEDDRLVDRLIDILA
jgi:hypothetical protein